MSSSTVISKRRVPSSRAAAELYRQSWDAAPPRAYGRLVGMLKSSVLAGGGGEEADYARAALVDADPESATANYAQAIAALIAGDDEDAQAWAARMSTRPTPSRRTGEAISALAAHDGARYAGALEAIVRDFERRSEHLTGVEIADTALMLDALAGRAGDGSGDREPGAAVALRGSLNDPRGRRYWFSAQIGRPRPPFLTARSWSVG